MFSVTPLVELINRLSQNKTQNLNGFNFIKDAVAIKLLPESPIFSVGSEGKLSCLIEKGVSPAQIEWFKDGARLESNKKFKIDKTMLLIKNVRTDDAGLYSCEIQVRDTKTMKEVNVKVIDQSIKIDCEDKSSYNDCKLVVSKGLCFKWAKFCCRTCRQAGFDIKAFF